MGKKIFARRTPVTGKAVRESDILEKWYVEAFKATSIPPSKRTPENIEAIKVYAELRAMQLSGALHDLSAVEKGIALLSKHFGMFSETHILETPPHEIHLHKESDCK